MQQTMEQILGLANQLPLVQRRQLVWNLEKSIVRDIQQEEEDIVASSEEIPGQILGDWYGPYDTVPVAPPLHHRPTGAVLPHGEPGPEFVALDLVHLTDAWWPLSEAGRYTYKHSEGLLRGERWYFLGRSGVLYEAAYAELLSSRARVETLYGAEAARRCRPDKPIVQLNLYQTTRP